MKTTKWNKAACANEALKYQTRADFARGNSSAYQKAHRMDWIEDICGHMQRPTKWTYAEIEKIAARYQTRQQFRVNETNAYHVAWRRDWLDAVCKHMPLTTKWSLNTIKIEAKKYKTRTEFALGNPAAYQKARKNGWLDQVSAGFVKPTHYPTKGGYKWTYSTLSYEAKKYQTRWGFAQGNSAAYRAARRNLSDEQFAEICSHMKSMKPHTDQKTA